MQNNFALLEKLSRPLEVDPEKRRLSTAEVIQYAERFISNIEETPVYYKEKNKLDLLQKFEFVDQGRPLRDLLEFIEIVVDGKGINPAGPGHLGYVPGGGIYPTALGDFIAAISNRYAGIYYANPGAVAMEDQCIRWMAKMVGYPADMAGHLSSGGSIATLTALTAARDHHNIVPENVRSQVIYLTQHTHHCILKALRIAALDFAQIRFVPMDDQYRMNVNALRDQVETDVREGLKPFLVVGSAGTTDTGMIDPLEEIASIARDYGCWFHVDAAYGGFFLMLEDMKVPFQGIELSDSVVLDPHKGLFLSYGTGAVIIKDRKAAFKTNCYRANYMQDADAEYSIPNPADISPELTKHFRGMRMWLSLQLLGLAPFRSTLREKLALAAYFYEEVHKLGFEVGPKPALSVCLFRINSGNPDADNDFNRKLTQSILDSGKIFISSTSIHDIYWLRICVMVFRTHKAHIDILLDLLKTNVNGRSRPD